MERKTSEHGKYYHLDSRVARVFWRGDFSSTILRCGDFFQNIKHFKAYFDVNFSLKRGFK